MSIAGHDTSGSSGATLLAEGLHALGLDAGEALRSRLLAFRDLLFQWNRAFNLTAVRDPDDMVVRHLLDSLAVHSCVPPGAVADVGTGAGLPGVPLALALPDRQFTLVDSVGKKIRFVRQACRELALDNVSPVQSRIEDYRPERPFGTVIARALAPPERLGPMVAPLLAPGGRLIAMMGRDPGRHPAPPGFDTLEVRRVKVPHLDAPRHLLICHRSRERD